MQILNCHCHYQILKFKAIPRLKVVSKKTRLCMHVLSAKPIESVLKKATQEYCYVLKKMQILNCHCHCQILKFKAIPRLKVQ